MRNDRTINAEDLDHEQGLTPLSDRAETGLALMIVTADAIATVPLGKRNRVVLGRGSDADIRIDDPLASKRHAQLSVRDTIEVQDLGSTNGTYVRDGRIEPNQPIVVQMGESIRVGATIIMVQRVRSSNALARKLWNHGDFRERAAEECERAAMVGKPLTLARLQSAQGDDAGIEAILRQQVGPPHVLAKYAPGQYEILLTEIATQDAENAVDDWVRNLAAAGVTCRFALATFPRDGRSVETLLSRANAQLRGGKKSERPPQPDARPLGANMQDIYKLARKAAASDMNILILGETGVGKEVMAEAIHKWSRRADKTLRIINCAGLSDTLLESELFGHEKGAFTDAKTAKTGLLEAAEGSTVFFDELGEMSAKMQQRLLRALQTREITRVGSVRPRKIDVRVIAATNRDMQAEVQAGNFRSDLFYRFGGFVINVPPLRERNEEVAWLAKSFAEDMGEGRPDGPLSFTPEAIRLLQTHDWPGNIRELRNVVERAVILSDGPSIGVQAVQLSNHTADTATFRADTVVPPSPAEPPAPTATSPAGALPAWAKLQEPERPLSDKEKDEMQHMLAVLQEVLWNISEASRQFPMPRRTFVSKMKRYGIPGPRARS